MFASVCFGGSRELPSCFGAFVGGVVGRVLAAAPRASFSVGCAAGGDALALQSLAVRGAAARVSVFCAGDASGAGFWRFSAFSVVQSVVAAGASPVWLAGGPLSAPLRERLAARSRAALVPGGVPVSVACWFLFSPVSRGSLAAARAAASRGHPGRRLLLRVGFFSARSAVRRRFVGRRCSVARSSAASFGCRRVLCCPRGPRSAVRRAAGCRGVRSRRRSVRPARVRRCSRAVRLARSASAGELPRSAGRALALRRSGAQPLFRRKRSDIVTEAPSIRRRSAR